MLDSCFLSSLSFSSLPCVSASFFLASSPSALEQERIQTDIENLLLTNLSIQTEAKEAERAAKTDAEEKKGIDVQGARPSAFDLSDLVGFFRGGMDVIVQVNNTTPTIKQTPYHRGPIYSVIRASPRLTMRACLVALQDGFSRCFESSRSQPWNWNLYLWPLWAMGVIVRYFVLFPIRLACLLAGLILVLLCLPILKFLPLPELVRSSLQRKLIRFLCGVFVFSWTGVIKYHGTLPQKKPGRIYVANHTSMIDVIVLSQMNTFSMVGQKHPGWIGFMQTHVLGIIGTVWFQRGEATDRAKSAQKMKDHIHNPNSNRLLVFPEGTCVLSSEPLHLSDGSVILAGDVRAGMELRGLINPVRVTSAESDDEAQPTSSDFYRVVLVDGTSYVVTAGHLVTLRMRGATRPHLTIDTECASNKGENAYFQLFDPDTLEWKKWGQRAVCGESDKQDPLSHANRQDARAAMYDALNNAAESDESSLPARYLLSGDLIDVSVDRLFASNFGALVNDKEYESGAESIGSTADESTVVHAHRVPGIDQFTFYFESAIEYRPHLKEAIMRIAGTSACAAEQIWARQSEEMHAFFASIPASDDGNNSQAMRDMSCIIADLQCRFDAGRSFDLYRVVDSTSPGVCSNTWRNSLSNVRLGAVKFTPPPHVTVVDDTFDSALRKMTDFTDEDGRPMHTMQNPYLLVERDADGFRYRQLVAGDSVRVVILVSKGMKDATGQQMLNLESALGALPIFEDAEAAGVVISEMDAGCGDASKINSTNSSFDGVIAANIRLMIEQLGAEVIVASGVSNLYRWSEFVPTMPGVTNHREFDLGVQFDYTPVGGVTRSVRVYLCAHPSVNRHMEQLRSAIGAIYQVYQPSDVPLQRIEKIHYDAPQQYARIEVDGDRRYVLANRVVQHNCVNNEYCVQFKQGVFDMDAEVCPIAIKYNKIFVDAFWNSKAQSFQGHLATLMCSWAVVCDVYYLEPQRIQPGETAIAFSNRVKKLIADRAGLRNVTYDGYLKHFEVKHSLVEKQQKMYADVIIKRLTPEEQEEIAREEAIDAQRKSTSPKAIVSPPVAMADPDSLTLTPSPDLPPLGHTIRTLGFSRSSSDPASSASPVRSGVPMHVVGSSADLMALLNQKQDEERHAAQREAHIKQRKK